MAKRPRTSKKPEERKKARRAPVGVGLLTRRALAEALSVDRPQPIHMMTITKWEQHGMPVAERGRRGRPSLYRLLDVEAWLKQREESSKVVGGSIFDVQKARAEKDVAQAKLAEQTFQMRAGELLPRVDVEKAWASEISAVRTMLLSWATTLADRLHRAATLEGVAGVEQMLEEEIHGVLRELADPSRIQEHDDEDDDDDHDRPSHSESAFA